MKKRWPEFVLGLLGGLFGVGAGFLTTLFGAVGEALEAQGAEAVTTGGSATFWVSLLGIVGSVVVLWKPRIGGILMLVAAVVGLFGSGLMYVLPGLLLIIAGLMGVFRKDKKSVEVQA
ncbi:MAG: hypothetical protein DIU76_11975 [Bacillota bacterium]|nr:MAG: hypothetical protein DIU76_11975 [Bacillota bacterium]